MCGRIQSWLVPKSCVAYHSPQHHPHDRRELHPMISLTPSHHIVSFFILALPPLIFARSAARVADLPISLLHFYFDGRQKGYQCKRRIYVLATGPSPLLWNNRRSNFLALEIYLFLKNANTLKIMSTTNQCNDVQAFRVSVERRLCQRLSIKLHMS